MTIEMTFDKDDKHFTQYLTPSDLVSNYGVTHSAISRWAQSGKIDSFIKKGRRYIVINAALWSTLRAYTSHSKQPEIIEKDTDEYFNWGWCFEGQEIMRLDPIDINDNSLI